MSFDDDEPIVRRQGSSSGHTFDHLDDDKKMPKTMHNMSFHDDEPIVRGHVFNHLDDGKVWERSVLKLTAPLAANELNVMVKLMGSSISSDRIPVDLVLVLDISGSMRGHKIRLLQTATEFVIKKLGPEDRLSIVTFNHTAHRLCPLRQITHKSEREILHLVKAIHTHGSTNISDGLHLGLKVLHHRRHHLNRVDAMMLMSDGEQNDGPDARLINLSHLPVHTFGFGADHDPNVLKTIAANSQDGTFSDVRDVEHLSLAFAQCLAGLLIVAVQNLTLTVSTKGLHSKIKEVLAGNYKQRKHGDSATSISFGNLYNEEVRNVIVKLSLPAVKYGQSEKVLNITYSYNQVKDVKGDPADVTRTANSREPENEEIVAELSRVRFAEMIKKVRILADGNHMVEARKKLQEARNVLEEFSYPNNRVIKELKHEHEHLSKQMASTHIYKEKGQSFALSFESSHDRQRFALRGDAEKHRMFATPRMDMHLEQVKSFLKHPTKALPTEKEDWEKERAAMLAHRGRRP